MLADWSWSDGDDDDDDDEQQQQYIICLPFLPLNVSL